MRKKVLAVVLTIAMCTMMSSTVFAASSSSSSSSSSSGSSSDSSGSTGSSNSKAPAVTEATKGNVNTDSVVVAVVQPDGSVSQVNLTQFTRQVSDTVVTAALSSAASGANPGEAVSAILTSPASDIFKATINALGGNIRLVNTGGYRVVASTVDSTGKTVASVGTVKGVTKYAYVILTAVNADGTVEIVEGTVDPVTLQVMGAFSSVPATITVSVIMAK